MNMSDLILAAFLREQQFFADYSSIVEDDMFDESPHKICINVYIDYITAYLKMPQELEMYAELDKYCTKYGIDAMIKQRAIETLQKCYKMTYNIDYVRDNFIKFATKNKLTKAVIDAAKDLKSKGDNLNEHDYEVIQERIEKALDIKARDSNGVLFKDVVDDPKTFIESQNRYDKSTVVQTGLPSIDNAHIAGGPLPGEMYVVSAPPGRGKSTLLVNIGAYALLKGKDVVHMFVGDNTEADGVLRYCARLTGVQMSQVMLNSQDYFNQWGFLKQNFNLGNLMLGAFSIGGPSIADIRSFVTKNMTRTGIKPAIVILDYIDNCRRNPNKNSYEALGELYVQFKNMCEELKLVGWTASQPKVEFWESETAGLASLAESSAKQHIIDGMMTMSKQSEGNYSLYVPKLRRGRSEFTVDLQLDYATMKIKESFVTRSQAPQSTLVTPPTAQSPANNSSMPVIAASNFGGTP